MTVKMNFHTHTTYCDGKETAEAMVSAAMDKGFAALGFSGHSYTAFDESYCMSREGVIAYKQDITRLKEKYKDSIKIYCGIEQDIYSEEPVSGFDYAIGSVHYIKKDGCFLPVDESADIMRNAIDKYFGGDSYAYARAYFETVGSVLEKTKGDIIGHFDLLTKFNEKGNFFDTRNSLYKQAGIEAIESLIPYNKPFEINTGAMYRGLRREPYPSLYFLREINKRGGSIILSSDSHDGASIGFKFAEAAQLAVEAGFRTTLVLTEKGFEEALL